MAIIIPPSLPDKEPQKQKSVSSQKEDFIERSMPSGIFAPQLRLDARASNVEIDSEALPEGTAGMQQGNTITLRDDDNTKTFIHEVAHRADEHSNISSRDEFQTALEMLPPPPRGFLPKEVADAFGETVQHPGVDHRGRDISRYSGALSIIDNFPGIKGNPVWTVGGTEWGGPIELFATLMAHSGGDITKIPPELRSFYEPFLGPQLTQAQQAEAARMLQMMPPPQEE